MDDGRPAPAAPEPSAPDAPDVPDVPDPAVPDAPARVRPRGATALLLAVAAVVGISAGTAVGYGVQAGREPEPLAALSQPGLAYPAQPLPAGQRPAPLSAAEDRGVRTNGDLRKLLVDRPAGARNAGAPGLDDGWLDIASYLDEFFDNPAYMLNQMIRNELRRVAGANWEKGSRNYEVRLVQFRTQVGAAVFTEGQRDSLAEEAAQEGLDAGDPIAGSGNGRYYIKAPVREPGYETVYQARAIVYRGDIAADLIIWDTSPVGKRDIRTLAEQQLERL
ncbi:hypothetical protein [Streptomyces tsukubensis]|uniref:hypothetical protein n=1 Tax=Streptomyces tsukubensis TaxID=83656 RepID=UPI00344BB2F1